MSGYCPDCGNQHCICDAIKNNKTGEGKMKPVFESEEQINNFFKKFVKDIFDYIDMLKREGYIKKSELEIAKENFYKYSNKNYTSETEVYVDLLEKEIERLKNGN